MLNLSDSHPNTCQFLHIYALQLSLLSICMIALLIDPLLVAIGDVLSLF